MILLPWLSRGQQIKLFDWCDYSCSHPNAAFLRTDDSQVTFAQTENYDLHYLQISWHVMPHTGEINGRIWYHFRAVDSLNTFHLDCSDSLEVYYVYYDGNILTDFSLADNVLSIPLNQTVMPGAFDSIYIAYAGQPRPSGLGGFMVSGHNGDSIVATLSEPYSSRDWWPSKMSLDDKIDSVDIALRVPEHHTGVSNGILKNIQYLGAPELIYEWETRYPIATYLIALATYPYEKLEHTINLNGDSLLMQHFLYPDYVDYAIAHQPLLDTVFYIFTNLFGPYPFANEKYGHAQWNRGGGMEHQTISFISVITHDLIAHELAHQWFGDKITCGSWSDIWLNEGFATYATWITYESMFGGQFRDAARLSVYEKAIQDSLGSVFCDDTTSVWRIFDPRLSYAKGAYILHSLRFLMGDSAFFAALRNYLVDPQLAYHFARTSHLQNHLEQTYGEPLVEFFNDWYYGKGYPNVDLYWSETTDGKVAIHLVQNAAAHPNNDFVFDMELPLRFVGAAVDTVIIVKQTQTVETFSIAVGSPVDSIIIDPEMYWLIGRKNVKRVNVLGDTKDMLIFPNPFSESIQIAAPFHEIIDLSVYSMDGRRSFQNKIPFTDLFLPLHIDTSDWASGLYVIVARTKDVTLRKKVVKIR